MHQKYLYNTKTCRICIIYLLTELLWCVIMNENLKNDWGVNIGHFTRNIHIFAAGQS